MKDFVFNSSASYNSMECVVEGVSYYVEHLWTEILLDSLNLKGSVHIAIILERLAEDTIKKNPAHS